MDWVSAYLYLLDIILEMKSRAIYLIVITIVLVSACNDSGSSSGGSANENRNDVAIAHAGGLEIPRIDDEAGDIYSHTVTYNEEEVLNYTFDWHAEKKHTRWVAFAFTDVSAEVNWSRNSWDGATWQGTTWTGDPFQPDPDIPEGERSELADFRGSGYDRGHLCASADRLFCQDANGQTFYLSNMSPQISSFNQDNWSELETQVRNWGRNSSFRDTLFVVKGGTIRDDQIIDYIGGSLESSPTQICVPQYYFMALLCKKYDNGQNTYKAIGFWVEHKDYDATPELSSWAVSIDELEELTGIDFFCNLPDVVEVAVEQVYSIAAWTGLD